MHAHKLVRTHPKSAYESILEHAEKMGFEITRGGETKKSRLRIMKVGPETLKANYDLKIKPELMTCRHEKVSGLWGEKCLTCDPYWAGECGSCTAPRWRCCC
jgi:hypothetical protein